MSALTAAHDRPRDANGELFPEYLATEPKQLRGAAASDGRGSTHRLDEIGRGDQTPEVLLVQFRARERLREALRQFEEQPL